MKSKVRSVLILFSIPMMVFGYQFAKDIYKMGVKDGHNTAVKMHMAKGK